MQIKTSPPKTLVAVTTSVRVVIATREDRSLKIGRLRAAIQSGKYSVASGDLADSILRHPLAYS